MAHGCTHVLPSGAAAWEAWPVPNDNRRTCGMCGALAYIRRRQRRRAKDKVILYKCFRVGCSGVVKNVQRPNGGFAERFSCDEHFDPDA